MRPSGATKDGHHQTKEPDKWRRLTLGLLGLTGVGLLFIAACYLGFGRPKNPQKSMRFGPGEIPPKDSVAVKGGVALVSEGGRLIGLDLECPHLGCQPNYSAQKAQFVCPCHGSLFDKTGRHLSGPAKKGLPRIAVTRHKSGAVIVDPNKRAGS